MSDYRVIHGDCREAMATLPENSVSAIVCDPPYGLSFMGKGWDHGVPGVEFWEAALRVAKPGAMLLAFGGTRTWHRMVCAIEDAGWEIRDQLCWLYGSGFPKSLDISKAIDRAAGAVRRPIGPNPNWRDPANNAAHHERWNAAKIPAHTTAPATDLAKQWRGYGTALKPCWEPIILAMKPCDGTFAANAQAYGVAGLNIDGGRIEVTGGDGVPQFTHRGDKAANTYGDGRCGSNRTGETSTAGRWPGNVALDEEAAALLDAQQGGASRFMYCAKASRSERNAGLEHLPKVQSNFAVGTGLSKNGDGTIRNNAHNAHPTVKPVDLMRWLVRLVKMPTGTVILDPFMGSGTTGVACAQEGVDFIGIEQDAQYLEIARARIDHARAERAEATRQGELLAGVSQ